MCVRVCLCVCVYVYLVCFSGTVHYLVMVPIVSVMVWLYRGVIATRGSVYWVRCMGTHTQTHTRTLLHLLRRSARAHTNTRQGSVRPSVV